MTRRITGAEARDLVAKAAKGPFNYDSATGKIVAGSRARCVAYLPGRTTHQDFSRPVDRFFHDDAILLAAAPDLAESLAVVEAERDALSRALTLSDAARDNDASAYLALIAERDALRAAVREYTEALDAHNALCLRHRRRDLPPIEDMEAHEHERNAAALHEYTALAALREAAK